MRFNFKTTEQYHEAWMYLMQTLTGFTYCREEQWVEPALDDEDEELNKWTVERLTKIQETTDFKTLVHLDTLSH